MQQPEVCSYLVMTNLTGNVRHTLGNLYGLRTWIEYGFKHIKNELGWADYRLTDYPSIERWWEIVSSAYWMMAAHASAFQPTAFAQSPVRQHPHWELVAGWKHSLNNLRLLIQPFLALYLLLPWLTVFEIPHLARALHQLVACLRLCT
jgi:hypothetical protein